MQIFADTIVASRNLRGNFRASLKNFSRSKYYIAVHQNRRNFHFDGRFIAAAITLDGVYLSCALVSGITPMLQVLQEILFNPEDHTKCTLLFANQTPADIMLKDELDALAKDHANVEIIYLVGARRWGLSHRPVGGCEPDF